LDSTDFRIDYHVVEKDVAFIEKLGVKIQTDTEIRSIDDLKKQGFDACYHRCRGLQTGIIEN
jgi:putative selenate reductase